MNKRTFSNLNRIWICNFMLIVSLIQHSLSWLNNMILSNPTAIAVSRDHKPDQTDERQRIEDAGGFVMWAGKFSS